MKHQELALSRLQAGRILWGGVGSGKSLTVLEWYRKNLPSHDIIVITTAKKRDTLDWEREAAKLGISKDPLLTRYGTLTVDSWNNLSKYAEVRSAFFVFDEQRLVGTGAWVKQFLKLAKCNEWIMLSATPGDVWLDYAPVFIANGWYRNITDFREQHVLYEPHNRYPKVRGYIGERKLEVLRNEVLIEMPFVKHTERIMNYLEVSYDVGLFDRAWKDRWNPYEDRPIRDVAELFRVCRKITATDDSRLALVRKLGELHKRVIVFYTYNYELELLRTLPGVVKEWNGHRKDPLPEGDAWFYLVQYVAGAEGWNCTTTDTMILYSLTYSYKNFEQALGRIDRLDTPYTKLYYYILASNSRVDQGIKKALDRKEAFNEAKFLSEAVDEGLE